MRIALKPYPAYRPSGIEWIPEVPTHWHTQQLKAICRLTYGDTLTADMRRNGNVPVYGSNGQVGWHATANTQSPCIVIGRKGSFGKVNFALQPIFAIDTTYFIDERHSNNNLRWLFYLLIWLRLDDITRDSAVPGHSFAYIEIGAVGNGVLNDKPVQVAFRNAPTRARRVVRSGDTIVSTVRTYLKAVWFAENPPDNLVCSTGFAVLTPREKSAPKFVSYLTQSNAFTDRVTAESVGIAYPAIPESKLGSFQVAVPPLSEQTAIAEHLNRATTGIDASIARARRQIELMQEYHTRLIADVVTGQLDVRDAVVELPLT